MSLTDTQLRVWLYYKRREGKDGKAFGKAATIGEWTGLAPGTVRNARSWLVRNGWLRPNGNSQSGLPMFLAVIPQLRPESPECHSAMTDVPLGNDTDVTAQLQQVSLGNETEVPTLKEQPESSNRKDSASDEAGVRELVSQTESGSPLLASLEDQNRKAMMVCTSKSHAVRVTAMAVLKVLKPVNGFVNGDIPWDDLLTIAEAVEIFETHLTRMDAIDFVRWNRTHKTGALVVRTPQQYLAAVRGNDEGDYFGLNQYKTHRDAVGDPAYGKCKQCKAAQYSYCPDCGHLPKSCECGMLADVIESDTSGRHASVVTKEEIDMIENELEPAGRGFEVEEAE